MSKSSVSFLLCHVSERSIPCPPMRTICPGRRSPAIPTSAATTTSSSPAERLRRSDDRRRSRRCSIPALDCAHSQGGDPADRIGQPAGCPAHRAGITFGAAEGGNPLGDRPFIRGFDTQGSIYVDGVRDLGAQSREVFATETIQIVRGSDSTLGGRGSAGGTINIISKLPQLDDFGSISGTMAMPTSSASPPTSICGSARWRRSGSKGCGMIRISRSRCALCAPLGCRAVAVARLGTPTRLTVSYYYLESHELPDAGIPYLYTIGNAPGTGTIASRPALGTITTAGGTTGYVDRRSSTG